MKIMMRKRGEGKVWKKVESSEYKGEADLQKLLYESPDLIPFDELGESVAAPRLFVKEAGLPGSGSSDLVGVDEFGGITVVECKLATNPDMRRKVIGQVLEYAAYLWQMSYDEFDSIFQMREGQPLAELMRQRLEEAAAGWSEEEFRAGVTETLQQGAFRLIIAVDKMTDELRRVLQYLNATGPAGFSVYGLEMHYLKDEQTELLVPQLVGTPPPPPPPGLDRFLREAAAKNPAEVVQVMRALFEFAQREAQVRWGKGKVTASYICQLLLHGVPVSLFTVTTNGKICLSLGTVHKRVPDSILKEWVVALRQTRGFHTLQDDLNKWPSFFLADVFADPASLEQFKQSVLALKEAIRRLDGPSA